MFDHIDNLAGLNKKLSLKKQLEQVHAAVIKQFPFISRIAVASFDHKSGIIKTFISSNAGEVPLAQYEVEIKKASSLMDIVELGKPRVVNDTSIFAKGKHLHTQALKSAGFSASYTMPMYQNEVFWGFVFFNAEQTHCFSPQALAILDIYGHLISSLVTHELTLVKTLLAALKTANEMVHYRDPETGEHLERMSRFSRIIAQQLATDPDYQLDDEFVEQVYMFAPMHDIGKIGIPDEILFKPGKLTSDERQVMQTHAIKGRELIESMIENFELSFFNGIGMLKNIAACHHESVDGEGYPEHLKGQEIPLEARIIAVADIFDALTSKRPYKEAWTNEDAYIMLERMADDKLDKACVDSLIKNSAKVLQIQRAFKD